ncbi:hypothetical protein N9B90_02210 [bacterium]|nr:hypothetical protein [bacterium]
MRRGDKRAVYLTAALATFSGFGYGYLLYFGEIEDEFGAVAHPWTSPLQAIHVLTVPLFVFAMGLIWRTHIFQKLVSGARPRRRSGIALLSQAIPMIVTGYLLQVAVDEAWRTAWIWSHVVTSIAFSVAFVLHLLVRASAPGAPTRVHT